MTRTQLLAAAMGLVALAACATPEHRVDNDADLLSEPRSGTETLAETVLREGRGDGCLVAGNAGDNRSGGLPGFSNPCRELRDLLAPPDFPPPPAPPPPLPGTDQAM